MIGFFKLSRGWMERLPFQNEPFSRRDACVWLMEHAAFEPRKVGSIQLNRGQLTHSLRYLARAWEWDEAKVRRFLKSVVNAKFIDAHTDAGQTVITICNYDEIQGGNRHADAANDGEPTQHRRVTDANNKEGKKEEGKEEKGPQHAFAGKTIKLSAADFEHWRATFPSIFDLRAELTSIDGWYQTQPPAKQKGWFHAVPGMLNRRHRENLLLAAGAEPIDPEFGGTRNAMVALPASW